MFDIGWMEMAAIAVVALIIIGPKDLPKAIRTVSHWVGRARSLAREFQSGLDDIVRESELRDIKGEIEATADMDLPGTIDGDLALPSPEDMTGKTDDYVDGIEKSDEKAKKKKKRGGKAAPKAKASGAKTAGAKGAKGGGAAKSGKARAKSSAKGAAKATRGRKTARAKTGA